MIPPDATPPVYLRCFRCGVVKDLNVREVSPYHEDDGLIDESIAPLHVLDCLSDGPDSPEGAGGWRIVVVCHECFHRLLPDMWISENCWKAINPWIPFDKLPFASDLISGDQKWNPIHYQPLVRPPNTTDGPSTIDGPSAN